MKKTLANAKIAIYYDWLNYSYGGAEKVLCQILSIFPNATLFTLFHDKNQTNWLPKNIKIETSFLQNWPRSNLLSPIYDLAAQSLDFTNYDIVISTTSNVGHCLLTSPNSLFICFYHNINRHLYLNPPKLLKPILNLYKIIDSIYSKRPDFSLCNSKTTQFRLSKYLNTTSKIIYPGIDSKYFVPISNPSNDFYLIVSRLVPHKNIDYVIRAFTRINSKLVIVGTGRDQNRLMNIANKSSNIIFTGQINEHKLLNYYQNCRALICPQVEDFGLTSIEAQSCGKPVITFNHGGVTETVINNVTGIYYKFQNENSLIKALIDFSKIQFDQNIIRRHALNFDQSKFMLNFKKEINILWQQHQNKFL